MSATNTASVNRDGAPAPTQLKGVVKQVLSGDTVVIRALKGNPPPEKQITFSYVSAPKLARRPGNVGEETKDESWAWESREYLRKKLIGQVVTFTFEKPANSNREYGYVWLNKGQDNEENVVESMVREGLVTVRRDSRQTPELQELIQLEDQAKAASRGRWSNVERVRNIKWTQENPHNIVEMCRYEPVDAIIEHVRDGSTVRAFLLPEFYYITLMMAGIRCNGMKLDGDGKPDPGVKLKCADEARQYVENRLLQREVKIRLESTNNANFIGTIIYPKGNIAEALLREGYARCVDWSMALMKEGAEKLRAAERIAKEKRLCLWEDYQSKAPQFNAKEKDFAGTVVEIVNGDAINVKLPNGQIKKVFFSSIRPPRDQRAGNDNEESTSKTNQQRSKDNNSARYRPLYDIPYMFEAREFLRKKLISKKVQCTLDYISPARENFPEKYCYTVSIGGQNVAEALVSKGLATVVRHRQDDDQRSSAYDHLLAAEAQATKSVQGLHARKDTATLRINDLTLDSSRIKVQYLPAWQRALRIDAIVEFVASGSRLRLYIPRDSCLVMFHLGGISCPRSSRPALNGMPAQQGEPYGDEALAFTRERVLQRDVTVHIDSTDKNGSSVIGWLWTDSNVNLSVALVEEGLAEVHFSAEKSEYYRQLKSAEDRAKVARKNLWTNYVEEQVVIEEPGVGKENILQEAEDDRVVSSGPKEKLNVIVTEITPELKEKEREKEKEKGKEKENLNKTSEKLQLKKETQEENDGKSNNNTTTTTTTQTITTTTNGNVNDKKSTKSATVDNKITTKTTTIDEKQPTTKIKQTTIKAAETTIPTTTVTNVDTTTATTTTATTTTTNKNNKIPETEIKEKTSNEIKSKPITTTTTTTTGESTKATTNEEKPKETTKTTNSIIIATNVEDDTKTITKTTTKLNDKKTNDSTKTTPTTTNVTTTTTTTSELPKTTNVTTTTTSESPTTTVAAVTTTTPKATTNCSKSTE